MSKKKLALFQSVIALLLCLSMLVSTTFAWFTDSVKTGINTIASGVLDVELHHSNAAVTDQQVDTTTALFMDLQGNPILWEPGVVSYENLRVTNAGDLALAYQLSLATANENFVVEPSGAQYGLSQILKVGFVEGGITATDRDGVINSVDAANWTSLSNFMQQGSLLPEGAGEFEQVWGVVVYWQPGEYDNFWNLNNGKQLNEGEVLSIDLGVKLIATQEVYEEDSFGNDYDTTAKKDVFPVFVDANATVTVIPNAQNQTTEEVILTSGQVSAVVPAGTQLAAGVNQLTMTVTELEGTGSNVVLNAGEKMRSLDVHIEGVDATNTQPITVTLKEVAPTGLNMGNYDLYHVENGVTNKMTLVDTFDAHNQFKYDPATGDITLYMATFSEVALVAGKSEWKGEFDYSWYTNAVAPVDGEAVTEYIIANADQLAAFGAIVGGMVEGIKQDSFSGKNVKLIADINLGDKESENNPDLIFYPIGYNSSDGKYEKTGVAVTTGFYNFCGTFDGNGHTIANFYQNTWEMKGDNNYYDATLQYYRDGMGLFGKVYGGTVKNLTVDHFSSDGEYTTTGCIAAYADGATFENIAITNCNPRVYNIGNGGIVGCVGWYAKAENLKTSFKNITVDNSNKISALWGSYDVACGGIVGQYYPTSGQTSANKPANGGISFDNCHISAIMDVYNDVCANYQYYAYRYAGMLIGSVRENVTIDGHVYPKMDGITAKDCTVHFGTWNDYYYCEFEKNGHPSYSGPDDYKFSRVPNNEIDTSNGKENATCIGHNHTDAEDNQAVYLPFNNLVTGYGWGVTTKVVGELEGVTILDREVANSAVKFDKADTAKDSYESESTVTIGELFKAAKIDDEKLTIRDGQVQVTVSPVGEGSTAGGTYAANTGDWTQGTLTFSGVGAAQITITDYYFCTATTINVTITERQPVEKFEVAFDHDPETDGNQNHVDEYLYRVGNKNVVPLDKLFKAKEGVTAGTVSVTVEAVNGSGASGTYSNNAIQFSGTGVVKVTITDNDYCTPTELLLEVVDATNLTGATGTTTGGNFVLICNVNTSTYVNYWNCTLYGNGFTYSLKGAPTAYNSKQGHGILITKNATLDNLVIVGDEYNSYGAYTEQNYYNTAIDVTGNTTIQNCRIANCAAPVKARSDVTIKNTTLSDGAVANLIIMSGTATLENVITSNNSYEGRNSLVGMGIVIHKDATETAKLVLNGTLTQYNFIYEADVPTDTYAKNLHGAMFSSDCSQYHFGTSPKRYVNTGIISLTDIFDNQDITDNAKTGYVGKAVTLSGNVGYVYTQPNTSGSVNNNVGAYKPTTQGAVPPSYSFDFTNKNYVAKTEGSNDFCYEENGVVNISMDEGDTFNWDTSILTIGKGITNYTVTMNGTDYTGKSIAFNTTGDYEVKYTYTDNNNSKLDENGNITTYSVTYTQTVKITVAVEKVATMHAEFKMGSSDQSTEKITVGNKTYISATGVNHDNKTWSYITVDGTKIFYPIVEAEIVSKKTAYFYVFKDVVSITDYVNGVAGETVVYNSSTTTMPSGLSVVKGHYNAFAKINSNWSTLTDANLTYSGASNVFKYAGSNAASSTPTTRSKALCFKSPDVTNKRDEYYTIVQYSYTDAAGSTYYYYVGYHMAAKADGCFAEGTLITLADGTQKPIEQITYTDELLAWDFHKGSYTTTTASLIESSEAGEYRVINLKFGDGTVVRIVDDHGFFDVTANNFVFIDEENVASYVGHDFVKVSENGGYESVELVGYDVTVETVKYYTIQTVIYNNCIAENMFTLTPPPEMLENDGWFDYFEIGNNMKYDEAKMQADIEKYGLYTYEDFAEYATYEQFIAFNGPYLKVLVGRGVITHEQILELLAYYKQWMA